MEENNETTLAGLFAIKVRVGNAEIEVFAPEKDFVLDESSRLIEQFILTPILSSPTGQEHSLNNGSSKESIAAEAKSEKAQNLAEFFKQFSGIQTNLDKILVMAYWCETKLGQSHFTIEDIEAKYEEIRQLGPAKLKRDLESLIRKSFLMPPKKENGQLVYTLSSSGIEEVKSKMVQA